VKPYDWDKVFGLTKEQVLYDNRAIQIGHYDLPIAFNTTLAKADDFKSWEDLGDPKWRGKILLEARGFGFAILAQEWGLEKTTALIKKIVANKPIITRSATPTSDALAGGQAAVAIGALGSRIEQFRQQGAPVDWARVGPMPSQVVTVFPVVGAPHPAAAKLWAAWWATLEAQKVFYDEQALGLLTGPAANPRGVELRQRNIPIVFETANVEEGRRNLEAVAKAIEAVQ
jgi:iron(III) transport system substrate-binding protein